MSWDYNDYLANELATINVSEELGLDIEISDERQFARKDEHKANRVYVVVKYLSVAYTYSSKTQPVQILVISEQDKKDKTETLLKNFTESHNWQLVESGSTWIKQQYNSPVVLSNFDENTIGYRSVYYITGTLYIMEDVLDFKNVKINGVDVKPLGMTFAYSMSGNTQQIGGQKIASTVKSISTLSLTITLPMLENGVSEDVLKIIHETESGNKDFTISYTIGSTNTAYTKTCKLVDVNIATAPAQIPALQLGFMR